MNSFERLTPVQRVLRQCATLPVYGVQLDRAALQNWADTKARSGEIHIASSYDNGDLVIMDAPAAPATCGPAITPKLSFLPCGHNAVARTLQRVVVGAFDPHGPFDIAAHGFANGPAAAETMRIAVRSVSDDQGDWNMYARLNEFRKTNRLLIGAGGPTGTWAVAAIVAIAVALLHGVDGVVTHPSVEGWTIQYRPHEPPITRFVSIREANPWQMSI